MCVNAEATESLQTSELGKTTSYDKIRYNPKQLYAISRAQKRQELSLDPKNIAFFGFDCWNHYEVSWLNSKGKPKVAIAEIIYDCHSPYIVESKSLKLYFNSLNDLRFTSLSELEKLIQRDLEAIIQFPVQIVIHPLGKFQSYILAGEFEGECIDGLDIECSQYQVNPHFLSTYSEHVKETLYSDLLKSNCLITQQPDWASIQISYVGPKINREGLLRYIVSYRHHNEFHEQCTERIFHDIQRFCQPTMLTVYSRYTRRGGIDINAYRSTHPNMTQPNIRLIRQ